MDVTEILENLRSQRDRVMECILALERLEAQKPRRGRPPNWITAARGTGAEGTVTDIGDGSTKRKRGRPRGRHK